MVRSAKGIFYDHGVELTEGGLYGRQSYLQVARERQLHLPSLYLLLWANFASFGVALLTQENAEQRLLQLLSSQTTVKHAVHSLWKTMQGNFNLLHEELSFFLMAAMLRVIEVCLYYSYHDTNIDVTQLHTAPISWSYLI